MLQKNGKYNLYRFMALVSIGTALICYGGAIMDPILGKLRSDQAGTSSTGSALVVASANQYHADNQVSRWDTALGAILQGSRVYIDDNGNINIPATAHYQINSVNLTAAMVGAESGLGNPLVSGYVLSSTTGGVRSWVATGAGGGNVTGPASSVLNQIARYGDATGKLIAASYIYIDDNGGVDVLGATTLESGLSCLGRNNAIGVGSLVTQYTLLQIGCRDGLSVDMTAQGGEDMWGVNNTSTFEIFTTTTNIYGERVATTVRAPGYSELLHNYYEMLIDRPQLANGATAENVYSLYITGPTAGTVKNVAIHAEGNVDLGTGYHYQINGVNLAYGDVGAEGALGNPLGNGYILSSTTGGVRSWIAAGSGGIGNVSGPGSSVVNQMPQFSDTTGKLLAASAMYSTDLAGNGTGWIWNRGDFATSGLGSELTVISTSSGLEGGIMSSRYSTTKPGTVSLVRYRGTPSSPSAALANDNVGEIRFEAYDVSAVRNVVAQIDATMKNSSDAGSLSFYTTNNSGSPTFLGCMNESQLTGLGGCTTPQTELEVKSSSTNTIRGIMSAQYSSDTLSGKYISAKYRGTESSPASVVTGDFLARWVAAGYDGTTINEAAAIAMYCDDTIAATRIPSIMTFSTSTSATPSVLTESMRINHMQYVGIGTATRDPVTRLQVSGLSTVADMSTFDMGINLNPVVLPVTTGVTTTATNGGSVNDGTHVYYFSYVTATGETSVLAQTGNVTTAAPNNTVHIASIPLSSDYRVTGRKIYRSTTGTAGNAYLVNTINDNTSTTYDDTLADSGLGATDNYGRGNSTAKLITINGASLMQVDSGGGGNTTFGYQAYQNLSSYPSATRNTAFGYLAEQSATSAKYDTAVGYSALNGLTSGQGNVAVGNSALLFLSTTNYNTAVGYLAGTNSTGASNVFVGQASGRSHSSGSYNTMLGATVGSSLTARTTANNIFLGYNAGYYETGGSKFMLDAFDRSTESASEAQALLYGVMNSTVTSQTLNANASVGINRTGITSFTPSSALHVAGTSLTSDMITADMGINLNPVAAPAVIAGGNFVASAGGSVNDGTHVYYFSFTTATAETGVTNESTVTTGGGLNTVTITNIPTSTDYRVTGRNIYRSLTGGAANSYLLYSIPDNTTTTYVDTTADTGLSVTNYYFRSNTTAKQLTINGGQLMFADNGNGGNTVMGYNCFPNLLSQPLAARNTGMGQYALQGLTQGTYNSSFGYYALNAVSTNSGNSALGYKVGQYTTGSYNAYMGYQAGSIQTSGAYNAIFGGYAGGAGSNRAFSHNNFFGNSAGAYETGSYKLIVDTSDRTTETASQQNAILYGVMSTTTATTSTTQILTVNGNLNLNSSTTNGVNWAGFTEGAEYNQSGKNFCGEYQWAVATTGAGPGSEVFLMSSTNFRAVMVDSSVIKFRGDIVAFAIDNGDVKSWEISGTIKRLSGAATTTLVGAITKTVSGADTGASTWDIDLQADTTNGSIKPLVIGQTSRTIKWGWRIKGRQIQL